MGRELDWELLYRRADIRRDDCIYTETSILDRPLQDILREDSSNQFLELPVSVTLEDEEDSAFALRWYEHVPTGLVIRCVIFEREQVELEEWIVYYVDRTGVLGVYHEAPTPENTVSLQRTRSFEF